VGDDGFSGIFGGEPVQNATIESMTRLFQQIGQREREQREKE
jgi:hypothetical protein